MFSSSQEEKQSMEDFMRWNVEALKKYLIDRGLGSSKKKAELAALCFAAQWFNIPLKPTPKDEKIENSIRDARTPQPGKIVFNTMRYRSSETVHRLGYFQSSVSFQIMFK